MLKTKSSLPSSITEPTATQKSSPRGEEVSNRRAGHGGNLWSLPFYARQKMQFQPQDGAPVAATKLTNIAARLHGVLAQEPEDARLTGGTRSLTRRLLGLNVTSGHRKAPKQAELGKNLPVGTQVA